MKLSENLWKYPYPVHDIEDAIEKYLKRKRKQYLELKIIYILENIVGLLSIYVIPSIIWVCITSNIETEWIQKVIFVLYILIHFIIVMGYMLPWEKNGAIPTLVDEFETSRFIWHDSIGIVLSEEIEKQDKWLYALANSAVRKCGDGRINLVDNYVRDNKERIEYLWLKYNIKRSERRKAKEYFKRHILDKVRE